MTTLSMPSTGQFSRYRFGLLTNTQALESPLTGSVQTLELPGARWFLEATLRPMEREEQTSSEQDLEQWLALLTALMGRAGRVYGFDPGGRTPRGSAGGSPVVNGGSQNGKTLAFQGAESHITGWLKKGDYFEVAGELKKCTERIDTGSGGAGILQFVPPIRQSPANGTTIITANPKCTMMLASDNEAAWDFDARVRDYGVTFKLIEVFTQ